jgi:hypothetical protein
MIMKDVSNRHNEVQFLEGRGLTSDTIPALTRDTYMCLCGAQLMKLLLSSILWHGVTG